MFNDNDVGVQRRAAKVSKNWSGSNCGGSASATAAKHSARALRTALSALLLAASLPFAVEALPTSTPFSVTPIAVPGSFEAENFDLGGEGVAYHDNTPGNQGGQYRLSEDVDIIVSTDPLGGGYVVNSFETGEWLSYTVNVEATVPYVIELRVSSMCSNSAFHIEIYDDKVTGSIIM